MQLIAVTALFIASKMEEIYPPKLEEYAYTTDGACSTQQIMDMEKKMLTVRLMSGAIFSYVLIISAPGLHAANADYHCMAATVSTDKRHI